MFFFFFKNFTRSVQTRRKESRQEEKTDDKHNTTDTIQKQKKAWCVCDMECGVWKCGGVAWGLALGGRCLVWCGLVWFEFGLVWFGLVWFGGVGWVMLSSTFLECSPSSPYGVVLSSSLFLGERCCSLPPSVWCVVVLVFSLSVGVVLPCSLIRGAASSPPSFGWWFSHRTKDNPIE